MNWLFSRALVAEYSADTCSDGAPSAPSSGSPMPQAYLSPDRMTVFSRPSRFGMTFAPLTDDRGEGLLTWFRAGFRARTSALQERAPASTAIGPGCGPTWRASLATFDRDSSTWKTVQRSLLEGSDECSVTWPRSGMTADGRCWELPMSGRRTSEIGCGWSAPTPTASDHKRTPQKLSYAHRPQTRGVPDDLAKWAVRRSGLDHAQLVPTLWEWMMGWPLGWTDLKPLGTDKFRQWLQQHGAFSADADMIGRTLFFCPPPLTRSSGPLPSLSGCISAHCAEGNT